MQNFSQHFPAGLTFVRYLVSSDSKNKQLDKEEISPLHEVKHTPRATNMKC